jgi:hypothetical protein
MAAITVPADGASHSSHVRGREKITALKVLGQFDATGIWEAG